MWTGGYRGSHDLLRSVQPGRCACDVAVNLAIPPEADGNTALVVDVASLRSGMAASGFPRGLPGVMVVARDEWPPVPSSPPRAGPAQAAAPSVAGGSHTSHEAAGQRATSVKPMPASSSRCSARAISGSSVLVRNLALSSVSISRYLVSM